MKCVGEWSHPFIPTSGRLDHGTPDGALLYNESQTVTLKVSDDIQSLKIIKQQLNGATEKTKLKLGVNKNVKMKFKNDKIYLEQKRLVQSNWDYGLYLGTTFNQRFVAVISLTENDDLMLENYSSYGLSKLKLKKKCVLPRM
jgi:hypothetical protein